MKSNFNLLHCYKILSNSPKWAAHVSDRKKKSTMTKSRALACSSAATISTTSTTATSSDDEDNDLFSSSTRPLGRKQSKALVLKRKRGDSAGEGHRLVMIECMKEKNRLAEAALQIRKVELEAKLFVKS
ncbi:unnamed protein product [Mucor hiemalis]